jgi:hypothetical protein
LVGAAPETGGLAGTVEVGQGVTGTAVEVGLGVTGTAVEVGLGVTGTAGAFHQRR